LYIAFSRAAASGTEVIVIPSAGGAERRLLVSTAWCSAVWAKQYCGPAWSPGGRYLTLVDRDSPKAPNSIFLFDIETRQKRKLTAPPRGFEDGLSVFSPDGRTLAFVRRPGWPLWDIYLLSLTEDCQPRGDPVQVTRDRTFIFGMDWAADGRSIVFGSSRGGVYALWRVANSGGAPDRVAVGGNDAFWPSIASKGSRLAFSYGNTNMHVWQTAAPGADRPAETATAPRRVSHSPMWDQQPAFSPDGQLIAWSSTHSGSHQIWVSGSGGARPRQLTHLEIPGADSPRWSPDGRTIAFRGFTPGPTPELYVIATEGGAPRRLTSNTSGVSVPNWSHDGGSLYFASDRGEGPVIWRVPARGGSPVPVARGWWPVESLDGKVIYSATVEEGVWKSAAGGKAPVLLARSGLPPIFESPDGAFVYYTGRDASIWRVPANGGNAAVVQNLGKRAIWTASKRGLYVLDPDAAGGPVIEFTPFVGSREVVRLPGEAASYIEPSGKAAGLAASPDGRWLVYLHREYTDTKIMLVENFR
jgi:Tol biopolymer transport system component